ncbi:hypothetical protein MNBD_GAMMA02-1306 [hydrothermal vent metagenome]|uniref:Uncharacterized protein n=1 Tax=hydrothermal vent metagenome TaxID=652676 RepID=A0A3B0WD45_9ZZZZ
MNNIIEQYTSQLEKLTEKNLGAKSAEPTIPSSQLVMPTIAWDWPPASIGMMLNSSFEFADTMPVSCQTETYYQPSADSFSNNYRNFLHLVQSTSPPLNRLIKKARKKIAVPSGSPANNPTPAGWTIVKINGLTRWCPIWNFSDTAHDWLHKVQNGSINNPGTITIKLKKHTRKNDLLMTNKPGSSISKPFNSNIPFEKVVSVRPKNQY